MKKETYELRGIVASMSCDENAKSVTLKSHQINGMCALIAMANVKGCSTEIAALGASMDSGDGVYGLRVEHGVFADNVFCFSRMSGTLCVAFSTKGALTGRLRTDYCNLLAHMALESGAVPRVERLVAMTLSEYGRLSCTDVELYDGQRCEMLLGEVTCHAMSTHEAVITVESECCRIMNRTAEERKIVLERMLRSGVTYVQGRSGELKVVGAHRKLRTDFKRLAAEFPEAYEACVTESIAKPYLKISFRRNAAERKRHSSSNI